jgi:WD40 repeat protein
MGQLNIQRLNWSSFLAVFFFCACFVGLQGFTMNAETASTHDFLKFKFEIKPSLSATEGIWNHYGKGVWSPDSTTVAIEHTSISSAVRFVDVANRRMIDGRAPGAIVTIAWSPKGDIVAIASFQSVRFLTYPGLRLVGEVKRKGASYGFNTTQANAIFTEDGRYLWIGCDGLNLDPMNAKATTEMFAAVKIDVSAFEIVEHLSLAGAGLQKVTGWTGRIQKGPAGRIVSISDISAHDDGPIVRYFWGIDVESGAALMNRMTVYSLPQRFLELYGVELSPIDDLFAVSGLVREAAGLVEGTAQLVLGAFSDLSSVTILPENVYGLRQAIFSRNGRYLIGGTTHGGERGQPGELLVWHVESRRLIQRLSGHNVFWIALSPDGQTVAAASGTGIRIYGVEQ